MSRLTVPPGFEDQKIIWRHMQTAGSFASGAGDHGLANSIWAFSSQIVRCVTAPVPHRYIADGDCAELHERSERDG